MSFFVLGPAGLIIWIFLVVLVAHLLHRQGWCLLLAVVGGVFTELGFITWLVTFVVVKLNGAQA